ncbi:MAG: glycosyltransferase, partial [Leptolyngbyaceae cyanobacterium bins.59]|nr:glycosyltransferase [Leptolyngbyaceae cyanobacterium bins.59]
MTHLMLCTDDPGVGGVAQYNHSLLRGLVQSGYRVTAVHATLLDDYLLTQQIQQGISHLQIALGNLDTWRSVLTESDTRPDLLICSNSNPFSNFPIKRLAIDLEVPYVVVEGLVEPHLADHPELIPHLPELASHYQRAKAVIAVSQDNLDWLHRRFGLPRYQGQVIYYGRPEEYFKPQDPEVRDRLRQELGIPTDGVVCLTTARIEARKGYQYQMEAIQQLMGSPVWPHLYFVWIGGGVFDRPLESQLQEIVAQLGIQDKVKFLGQRSDVGDWLNVADIFVFPSQLEGMPMCVMEAMAKGLPVVASAVSGIPEELGETGKLLPDPKTNPEGTVRELVETLEQWVTDSEKRRAIGQAGRQRAKQLFRETRMLEQTLQVLQRSMLPKGDYVSPGLVLVRPDDCFPNLIISDPTPHPWPYLRREIPHNWYVDRRQPTIGFLSRDEAHILYNTALQFKGKRALEIGCWMGWSACHLALAGVQLDVVDPLLDNPVIHDSVRDSLERAGVLESVRLLPGYSPARVEQLAKQEHCKWSLIFIDGNHEVPGPLEDAIACEPLAEEDAIIVFHDLAAPAVAQGLDYLRDRGWQTMVYQTMQIMGVAWRGKVQPIQHQPDPDVRWSLPAYLQGYVISSRTGQTSPESLPISQDIYRGSPTDRSPHILIDGVFFQLYRTGISRVWRSLLETWLHNGFSQYLTILDRAGTVPKLPGYRYLTLPPYDYNETDRDRELLQQVCDEQGADLFISSYYTTPLTTPSVFMAYDMIPEMLGGDLDEPMWREKHYGIQHGIAYICISQNTAQDLLQCFPEIDPQRVKVAPCGVSPLFRPAAATSIQEFRYKYGIQRPYFLLVGPGMGYKNTVLFFRAFAQLATRQGFELVCTSNAGHFLDEFRQYTAGCTVHSLSLSDEELNVAYSGAIALVYPSRYEGFGMPVAEALASGCPVITCPTSSIPEVAGESALYVGTDDVEGMVEALCEVQKPSVRRKLVETGLKQVQQFTWKNMADQVSQTLIQTTLIPLNLRKTNLIAFPDWSKPEEVLGADLAEVIAAIVRHPQKEEITLLLDARDPSAEEANLLLSSITMHLLMTEDLDISDGPEISLISSLGVLQWQTLLLQLQARVPLVHENGEAIAQIGAENLPPWTAKDD